MRLLVASLVLALTPTLFAQADCPSDRRALLILGTFHMKPSGQDAVYQKSNITTAARQQEIEALVEKLARFRPTKVAIESARDSSVWNDRYAAWRRGDAALGTNEIEQIGFRLAKRMDLPALTPVDYPMWMNGLTPIERHEPKKKPAAAAPAPATSTPSGQMSEVQQQIAKDEAHFASHTIAEYLAHLNAPERAAINHDWDVMSNLVPGDGIALYSNTDLVTNWYKRNLRIFTNVLDASAPGDRILLLIGAGHKHILGEWAARHSDVCDVDEAAYLR
jgi:hypothetical protein